MKLRTDTAAVLLAIIVVIFTIMLGIFVNLASSNLKELSRFVLLVLITALSAAVVSAYIVVRSRKKLAAAKTNQIMIIYAKEDSKAAEDVYDLLASAGFKAWMDTRDLLPGQIWRDSVESAIENSRLLVVLLSQNAFKKSGFVGKELSLALDTLQEPHEGYSSLIPVRLEPVDVPIEQLREIQWVDLFDEHGRERLVDAIRYLMSMQNQ